MEINALQQQPAFVQARTPPAISSDFETFLKMLTAQMTNQDPLAPMESADFAVQLATFSGVEQQVQTNELLKSLSIQMGMNGMADMASWFGRETRAPVPARFDGAPITVVPNPAALADQVALVVTDADGTEVQRLTLPVSADPVDWTGIGTDGETLPPGTYRFETVSYKDGEVILQETTDIYARITEVRADGSDVLLVLEGGGTIPALSVGALRQARD